MIKLMTALWILATLKHVDLTACKAFCDNKANLTTFLTINNARITSMHTLVQDCDISSASAMEILLSCTKTAM